MTLELAAEPVPLYWTERGQVIRVAGTRISLDLVVNEFLAGRSAKRIAWRFPSLKLADIHAVIAYYLRHKAEVDEYIAEGERQAVENRRQVEATMAMRAAQKRAGRAAPDAAP